MGKDAVLKRDLDLKPSDIDSRDLIISLGIFIMLLLVNKVIKHRW